MIRLVVARRRMLLPEGMNCLSQASTTRCRDQLDLHCSSNGPCSGLGSGLRIKMYTSYVTYLNAINGKWHALLWLRTGLGRQ